MKFRFHLFIVLITLALSGCLSLADDITPPPHYQSPTPPPTLGPLFPANPPSPQRGAAIFAEKCAPCHGPTGMGDGPASADLPNPVPALALPELAQKASLATWFTTITQGNIEKFMPPFLSLTDQQRWDVAAYAQTLSIESEQLKRGQAIYAASCSTCHGADGSKISNGDLTNNEVMAKFSLTDLVMFTAEGVGEMPGFSAELSPADLYAVAAYARSFGFSASQPDSTPQPTNQLTPSAEATATLQAVSDTGLGVFKGQVSSGSGEKLPAGIKVTLHGVEHSATTNAIQEVLTVETETDENGFFSFSDIVLINESAFYASLEYEGFQYSSDIVFVQDNLTQFEVPIIIYAPSTDNSILVADQLHILFDYSKPNIVQVIQFFVISNPSLSTIVAEQEGQPVLTFNLPQGAANLQFEDGVLGERFILTESGFGDLQPVPPTSPETGQYQIIYAYELPAADSLEIRQTLNLSAKTVSVLTPLGVTLAGDGFVSVGEQSMGSGTRFDVFTKSDLPSGSELAFTINGRPNADGVSTGSQPDATNFYIMMAVGLLGLGLILMGAYLFWRDRRHDLETETETDVQAAANLDEVMDAIIALDDQFRAGNIAEEPYKKRRAEFVKQLKQQYQ